jgi:hypothetical protein
VNIDNGWGGWVDHPFLAGAAFAWSAALIGSMFYALPAGCPPYYWGGYGYYHCGGAFYEPRYEGDTIVYVTVPDPSGGSSKTGEQAPAGTPPAEPAPSSLTPPSGAPPTSPPPPAGGAQP